VSNSSCRAGFLPKLITACRRLPYSELGGYYVLVSTDFYYEGAKEAVAMQREFGGQRIVFADSVSGSGVERIGIERGQPV